MIKKVVNHYSEEFKWRVVQEVISAKFSKEEARKVYGIKSNSAILYWMRKYSGNDQYRINQKVGTFVSMAQDKELNELKAKMALLEQDLRRANLRADLWQQMIEVAEDRLNIEIKKKYGAQQLKVLSEINNRQQ